MKKISRFLDILGLLTTIAEAIARIKKDKQNEHKTPTGNLRCSLESCEPKEHVDKSLHR